MGGVALTHDRTKPPSDEIMARVVAEWRGWKHGLDTIDFRHGKVFRGNGCSHYVPVDDPRTDTDAALELFHSVARQEVENEWGGQMPIVLLPDRWRIWVDGNRKYLPLSGEPFRTSVCWLAVDVLGVG